MFSSILHCCSDFDFLEIYSSKALEYSYLGIMSFWLVCVNPASICKFSAINCFSSVSEAVICFFLNIRKLFLLAFLHMAFACKIMQGANKTWLSLWILKILTLYYMFLEGAVTISDVSLEVSLTLLNILIGINTHDLRDEERSDSLCS